MKYFHYLLLVNETMEAHNIEQRGEYRMTRSMFAHEARNQSGRSRGHFSKEFVTTKNGRVRLSENGNLVPVSGKRNSLKEMISNKKVRARNNLAETADTANTMPRNIRALPWMPNFDYTDNSSEELPCQTLLHCNERLWRMGDSTPMSLSMKVTSNINFKNQSLSDLCWTSRMKRGLLEPPSTQTHIVTPKVSEPVESVGEPSMKTVIEPLRNFSPSLTVASTPASSRKTRDAFTTPKNKKTRVPSCTTPLPRKQKKFKKQKSFEKIVSSKKGRRKNKRRTSVRTTSPPGITYNFHSLNVLRDRQTGKSLATECCKDESSTQLPKKDPNINRAVVTPVHDIPDRISSSVTSFADATALIKSSTVTEDKNINEVTIVETAPVIVEKVSEREMRASLIRGNSSGSFEQIPVLPTTPMKIESTKKEDEENFFRSILSSPPRNACHSFDGSLKPPLLQRAISLVEDMRITGDNIEENGSDYDLLIGSH